MNALLVSTYDLGRQPFGLASPAAWLERAGVAVACVDTSREPLRDEQIRGAEFVAFYLPMHTATRLAGPLIAHARAVNPRARLAAYGLYAPLNAAWLRLQGIDDVLGPEAEADLVRLATTRRAERTDEETIRDGAAGTEGRPVARLAFVPPARGGLPPLTRYAALQMPDGSRRTVGSTEASRGCKHRCRHCPIVPVYRGAFRIVPVDVVMEDLHALVAAGAEHITFGDADFFNGPTHARRLVQRLARELPRLTYDVTIKVEHLLAHRDMLPLLRDTGCLFITSAVESLDDDVLAKLRKGHSRADFLRVVDLCRELDIVLTPTFVPFTPWTTLDSYRELLTVVERLDLVEQVAPVQLGIRLLVTAASALLELPEIRDGVATFDPRSLTYPWRHADPRVDRLQEQVMQRVAEGAQRSRRQTFRAIVELARDPAAPVAASAGIGMAGSATGATAPRLTESWYCCAEPVEPLGV